MKVSDLIETLSKLDPNKTVYPQVVAEDGTVWNIWMEIHDIPNSRLVQLRLFHPDLKTLPKN